MAWVKQIVTITEKRRTYLLGEFKGKFYGLLDLRKEENPFTRYYDLKVYEAEVVVKDKEGIHPAPMGPFEGFTPDDTFPGKVPDPLPCDIRMAPFEDLYKLELHEPRFRSGSIQIIDHQYEGDEVFGTLKAVVTGYVEDMVERQEEQEVWIGAPLEAPKQEDPVVPLAAATPPKSFGSYRSHLGASTYRHAYPAREAGCLEVVLVLIGLIILLAWMFSLGPASVILLLLYLGLPFLILVSPRIANILMSILLLFIFGVFTFGVIQSIRESSGSTNPFSTAIDDPRESTVVRRENQALLIRDRDSDRRTVSHVDNNLDQSNREVPTESPTELDTIISHHRIWEDYNGNRYEGDLQILLSSFKQSSLNRTLYNSPADKLTYKYDALLYNLNAYDKSMLNRVYHMFDSLKKANNLDAKAFAEVIVSCVQDIPYTLILHDACNLYLYNDNFIRKYLSDGNSCEGGVKFGLYAPAEFVGGLKGDCDTRTLLLFTILSHYNYEVAILSSEYYKHSLLAINLPYQGSYKDLYGKRFYAWETTYPNVRPGILPTEIANMDYWRVSLINQRTKR